MLKITCDCGVVAFLNTLPGETVSSVKSPFEETKFNPMPPRRFSQLIAEMTPDQLKEAERVIYSYEEGTP